MSALFQNVQQPSIHIGSMDINQLRDHQKKMMDEKEVERCPEASFLNNDKKQTYKVIAESLNDIVTVKRRGRPIGSKNVVKLTK
jgi:hypothetical protein